MDYLIVCIVEDIQHNCVQVYSSVHCKLIFPKHIQLYRLDQWEASHVENNDDFLYTSVH